MSLKVIVPNGRTEITVNGLHQWNYGQQLEIEAVDLPAMVEVHFACSGMETAVVRSCAVVDGKVTAAIPDRCLEQTTPVVAWVYAIGETSGETVLTVKMPIVARTQPQPAPTVPEDVSDKYTEAVEAMNALVAESEKILDNAANEIEKSVADKIQRGAWTAAKAQRAVEADSADSADTAKSADLLKPNYVEPTAPESFGPISYRLTEVGVYLVVLGAGNATVTSIICVKSLGQFAFGSLTMFGENADFTDKAYVMCDAEGELSAHYSGTLVPGTGGVLPIIAVYKLADIEEVL